MENTKVIKAGIYHEVEVTADRMGRMSVVVYDKTESGSWGSGKKIVDVELPQRSPRAEHKDAFKPTVKVAEGIEVEIIKK